jgi:hypothetical protein
MNANDKAIWTNRALNFVGAAGVLVSAAAVAVSEIGSLTEALTSAGIVPAKWAGVAAGIAIAGHFAAKWSKTPSQAIAAAVPPSKAAPPAPGAEP